MDARQRIADALLKASAQQKFGYRPFDPAVNEARDIGLGGPSTEYLATELDPTGAVMNYPTIWWNAGGDPVLMDPFQAYDQALSYEETSGLRFPRFKTIPQAEIAAENRSAMGGGQKGRLASLFGK